MTQKVVKKRQVCIKQWIPHDDKVSFSASKESIERLGLEEQKEEK